MACRLCREWPRDLAVVRSAILLEPHTRELLHRLKYHGWRRLAIECAAAMAPLLNRVGPGDLVPVAMSRSRERQRGYNQAEALARALAALTGRRLDRGRLWRRRHVGSQTRLGQADRAANLAGVFGAREDEGPVILVDDVFTTGATLVSAATACLDAGALRVGALTFARAEAPLVAAARRQATTLFSGA
jgi:ComF family protein